MGYILGARERIQRICQSTANSVRLVCVVFVWVPSLLQNRTMFVDGTGMSDMAASETGGGSQAPDEESEGYGDDEDDDSGSGEGDVSDDADEDGDDEDEGAGG